jgi:hypothetical protein|tara:strand:- start:1189 stop:1707 length:519 start_codon:yes stop_codon:yes gene_type:complete
LRIAGDFARFGGRDADRDVVGVTVRPFGSEREHDIRSKRADQPDDFAGQLIRVRVGEPAVFVVEAVDCLNADRPTGSSELALADPAERLACRRARIANLPGVALRERHEHGLGVCRSVLRERSSGAEGLAVRVCEYTQQPPHTLFHCFVRHENPTLSLDSCRVYQRAAQTGN